MTSEELSKLISKCYDNDPEVRKKAVDELIKFKEHPAAAFALLELLFDNDESVREKVRVALNIEKDPTVSYEKLLEGKVEEIKEKVPEEKREKLDTFIKPLVKKRQTGMAKQLLEFLDENIGTLAEQTEEEVEEQEKESGDDIYGRFYNMVQLGANEKELKREAERLKKDIERALKLAIRQSKKSPFSLTEIKEGMRSVTTGELSVIGVSSGVSGSGKNSKEYVKLIVEEGEIQMPVFIFEGKGDGIRRGDKVVLQRAYSKKINGVLSLVAGKRARVIIIRE